MISGLAIYPNPPKEKLVPKWPSANVFAKDELYNSWLLRATDPTYTGAPISTASAGQVNSWNTESTLLWLTSQGGKKIILQLNKTPMTTRKLDYETGSQLCFSRTVNNRLYRLEGTKIKVMTFSKINGQWEYHNEILLYDFATILPAGFNVVWTSNFLCSSDDSTFAVAFSEGVQNTGHLICVFKRGIGGQLINTQKFPEPFFIHGLFQTPNAKYLQISGVKGSGEYIYNYASKSLKRVNLSGHNINTLNYYFAGGPGGGQYGKLPLDDPSTEPNLIIPPQDLPDPFLLADKHGSWNTTQLGDSAPFVISVQNNGDVTTAWEGEILNMYPYTGHVDRLCKHYSSGLSPIFNIMCAIAVQSQDGKYVAFGTDLMEGIEGDVFILKVG